MKRFEASGMMRPLGHKHRSSKTIANSLCTIPATLYLNAFRRRFHEKDWLSLLRPLD